MGGKNAQHIGSSYDESVNGSNVSAGNGVTLAAGQNGGGNLSVLGSNVTADKGGIALVSTGDINIGSVSETHDSQSWSHQNSSGFLANTETTDTANAHAVYANGSTISGDTVMGVAGRDMTISGSTVAATNDVALSAGHDLTIDTTQDKSQSSSFHQETKTGMGASGTAISYGTHDQKDTYNDASVRNNASLIGSTDGSVHLSAGNDLHVTGSDLIAAKDMIGTGANVTIDAATDTSHHDETHETKQSGVSLGVKGGLVDMIQSAADQADASGKSEDSRASTLHSIAAAGSLAAAGESMASGKPDVKVELSFGSSHSKDTFTEDTTTQRGSNVQAGGTATFAATGSDTPGSGNVTIAGSNVNATDVVLAAKNQVNLVNTTDTDSTRSTNESSSSSVGVSYGTQGWGADASMSKAHGYANADSASQNSTHINAGNSATIISGGDTNIVGANVNAKTVSADIGGNLNIASVQDTMTSDAHQESMSAGASVSQGGGGGSFSTQHGDANGNYAGVAEQSGIYAGDGGFNINVKGNTDLKGAVIASDADASKNTLNTGTLTFSDIENHSDYSASSSGFSAGASIGAPAKGTGTSSVSGAGGAVPMMSQSDSGNSDATTRSAIGAGSINIADKDHQTQDIGSLSRDTVDTNGTVSKLPDVKNLLDKQGDMMNAASAAGEAVATQIGAIADAKRDSALKDAKDALARGDLDAAQSALDTVNLWKEGGDARTALHIAGGALIGGLDGGALGGVGGAAAAGLSSTLAPQTRALANSVGEATGSSLIGNLAGNIASGLAGAAVGGTAGAAMGSNVNLYNAGHNDKEMETQKEAQALHQQLERERAMLGQVVAPSTTDDGPAVIRGAGGAIGGKSATSGGTANAATYGGLKGQLADENLANIAAQDPRLAAAVNGSGSKNINFSIGTGTAAEADQLGKAWVGDGAKMTTDGTGWISSDGTRGYRMPSEKDSQFATTGVQANFETYAVNPVTGQRIKTGNGHLNVSK